MHMNSNNIADIKPVVMVKKNGIKSLRIKTEGQAPRKKNNLAQNSENIQYSKMLKTEPSERSLETVEKFKLNVCVRVRPKAIDELQDKRNAMAGKIQIWDDKTISINNNEYSGQMKHKRSQSYANDKISIEPTQAFEFDRVFDEYSTNENIFEESVSPFLDYLMQGYNSTIFAYGASGSGKTYTMQGNRKSEGITQLMCKRLFQKIEEVSEEKDFNIKFSYVEIYNETIRELIPQLSQQQGINGSSKKNVQNNLELREDPVKGTILANVSEIPIENCQQVQMLIDLGNRNRTVDATALNAFSSRSHAIIQIHLQHKDKNQGINESMQFSTLTLVDLAGSEKSGVSQNQQETQKINQSLLVLGYCINELSKGNKNSHIPYRNSKLTRMLKNSLGGNCRTLMLTTVSSANTSYEDSMNSLLYASHAKRIKNILFKNEVVSSQHVSNYAHVVEGLQRQNEQLKKLMQESVQGGIVLTEDKLKNIFHLEQHLIYYNNKGSQLPHEVKSNAFTKEEAQKLQFEIQKHFQLEMECYKDISYNSDRISLIEQELQERNSQADEESRSLQCNSYDATCKQLLKDYNNNLKLSSLKQNKQTSIQKLEELSQKRIDMLQKIKGFHNEERNKLLELFNQKTKPFKEMIERHNFYNQQKNDQDNQIDYLLQELQIKDSIIKTQNNLISVSNLDAHSISYPKSNLANYHDYELIEQESKSLIELIASQEHTKAASSQNVVLPSLIKQKPRNSTQIGGTSLNKNRRSQSESDPFLQQPLRLSYSFAVQKMQPINQLKKLNNSSSNNSNIINNSQNPLSQLISKDVYVKSKQNSNSKFKKVMSKISVDTTIPTETNDITKSTQNHNSSSLSNCINNNININAANLNSNNNNNNHSRNKGIKSDIDYLSKYTEMVSQSQNGKQNLSPKIHDGNRSSRSYSLQRQKVGQSQKQLQNVLQSSRVRNSQVTSMNGKSKFKQPYLSKLLVDYSNYMYSDLGALSNQDIVLHKSSSKPNREFKQNGSIEDISYQQRVHTEMPERNHSLNVLGDISKDQSIEFQNLFVNNKKHNIYGNNLSGNNNAYSNSRINSSSQRKYLLSQKRKSQHLHNLSLQNN